jgi:hypothetical protein
MKKSARRNHPPVFKLKVTLAAIKAIEPLLSRRSSAGRHQGTARQDRRADARERLYRGILAHQYSRSGFRSLLCVALVDGKEGLPHQRGLTVDTFLEDGRTDGLNALVLRSRRTRKFSEMSRKSGLTFFG